MRYEALVVFYLNFLPSVVKLVVSGLVYYMCMYKLASYRQ